VSVYACVCICIGVCKLHTTCRTKNSLVHVPIHKFLGLCRNVRLGDSVREQETERAGERGREGKGERGGGEKGRDEESVCVCADLCVGG